LVTDVFDWFSAYQPARRENVLNTVSHVAQRDVAALGLPAQSSCKVPDEAEILEKTVDLQPGEKQTVGGILLSMASE
jgi:hypothetical protein